MCNLTFQHVRASIRLDTPTTHGPHGHLVVAETGHANRLNEAEAFVKGYERGVICRGSVYWVGDEGPPTDD